MSKDFPIPPGYASLEDAIARARSLWLSDGLPKLHGLLICGELNGFAADKKGETIILPSGFWVGKQIAGMNSLGYMSTGESRGRPVLLEADLNAKVPTVAAFAKAQREAVHKTEPETTSSKNKGGAPRIFSESDFMIEAFRVLYEASPFPKTEAQFRTMALDAYAKKYPKAPSPDWARPHIRKIVDELAIKFKADSN